MTKPKTLDQLQAEKERAETQLAQEQHKLNRLENRKKYLEKGERQKRTHRLCNLGGTIESLAPEVKDLTRTEMTELMEHIFSLSEVQRAVRHMAITHISQAKLVGPKCANPYELAAEWERIEQRLRDDRFWFMFNGKASESFTRIDKLFEIITHTEEKVKLDRLAPYYAIEEKKDELWWEKLLNLFWMLEQCYNDVEVYHYIGWLRHFSGAQFSSLYALYEHDKINFKQNLQKIIINKDCKDRENVLI